MPLRKHAPLVGGALAVSPAAPPPQETTCPIASGSARTDRCLRMISLSCSSLFVRPWLRPIMRWAALPLRMLVQALRFDFSLGQRVMPADKVLQGLKDH